VNHAPEDIRHEIVLSAYLGKYFIKVKVDSVTIDAVPSIRPTVLVSLALHFLLKNERVSEWLNIAVRLQYN
jgi:hypothetical protein